MVIDRQKRKNLIEMFNILTEAFSHIDEFIDVGNTGAATEMLSQCQESAVVLGTSIEQLCGEGTRTVSMLEKLCEDIFTASQQLENGVRTAIASLQETIDIFNEELPSKKEIVFLPCSSNLWNGFDYLYRQLISDEACSVTVIPIPWYDKAPDGSIGGDAVHYDTEGYPEYVTLTSLNSYDFAGIHPDIIYIQNIFDNSNLGSSLHPAFYTGKLKTLCDKLVFIPPFVFTEPTVNSKEQIEKLREYLCFPSISNVDEIVLQSENMKQALITLLAGEEESAYRKELDQKITFETNSRISAIRKLICDMAESADTLGSINIPENWKAYLYKPDGTRKKVILYSNSVPTMLEHSTKLVDKIKSSFDIFKQNSDNIALIWRPHPLLLEVAVQLRPEISCSFQELIDYFSNEGIGIIDNNPDPAPSIALADAYYGDPGSVMELFKLTGKPIMIENPDIG
ncbi:MAG: hypothetical protein IJ683_11795 [Butyrivibrio sp.]|nr:hypothetical protein [Butyrivibrio sp.]MBR1642994.1 hypothetical protein [Butyrivibrio sp.]